MYAMNVNKNGIPVVNAKRTSRKKMQKLNYREYAEFTGIENDEKITIIVLNFKPVVQAMLQDGWILQRYSSGEIV